MTRRKIYVGSMGPILYDDQGSMNDPNGLFSGKTRHGIVTDGQLLITGTPTDPNHVARLQDVDALLQLCEVSDIDNPATELASLSASRSGSILIVVKRSTETDTVALYVWDDTILSANVPYEVLGNGGTWILLETTKRGFTGELLDSSTASIATVVNGRIISLPSQLFNLTTEASEKITTEGGDYLMVLYG